MKLYQATKETHFLDGVSYCSYGIRCGEELVEDVTLDQDGINALVALCNRLELSPCHLRDVVLDYLNGGLDALERSLAPGGKAAEKAADGLPSGGPEEGEWSRDLERQMSLLLSDCVPGGVMSGYYEKDFPLYFVNDGMLEYLGYGRQEFVRAIDGKIVNCIHPDDREMVCGEVDRMLAQGDSYTVTYRMLCKGGGCIWVYDKGRLVTLESGRQIIVSMCLDITGQVEAESELQSIIRCSLCGVFKARMDAGFTLVYANDCYYGLHGHTRSSLMQDHQGQAAALVHPEDLPQVTARLEQAVAAGESSISFEYRIIRPEGTAAWLHMSGALSGQGEDALLTGMVIDITERRRMEEQLRLSDERFHIAIHQSGINVWEYDPRTRAVLSSEGGQCVHGAARPLQNMPEGLIKSGRVAARSVPELRRMYRELHEGADKADCTIQVKGEDGVFRWERVHYTNIFDRKGRPVRSVAVSEDVTEQKEAELRFFQEEKLRELLSMDIIASCRVNLDSRRVEQLWSLNPLPRAFEEAEGFDGLFHALLQIIQSPEEGKRFAETFRLSALRECYEQKRTLYGEFRCRSVEGTIKWLSFRGKLLRDPENHELILFVYVQDIDERKKTELALRERAERDAVTGLYNKQTTQSMFTEALSRNRDNPGDCVLVMVDLDNFKQINDTHGHFYGDRVLGEIGRALMSAFGGNALAGRFGGDEFMLLASNVPSVRWARSQVDELCRRMNRTYLVEDKALQVSISAGLSFSPHKSADFQIMYQQADDALYAAKRQGKNGYAVYDGQDTGGYAIAPGHGTCVARDHAACQCMMDQLEDMALVIDQERHEILYMNQAAREAFCRDGVTYLGRKCYELLHGFSKPCLFCKNHLPREGCFQSWENQNTKTHRRLRVRDKLLSWNGRPARLEIFSPMEKRSRPDVHQTSQVLLECTEMLLVSKELSDGIRAVLEEIGKYYDADRVCMAPVFGEKSVIPRQSWTQEGLSRLAPFRSGEDSGPARAWQSLLRRERAVLLPDLSDGAADAAVGRAFLCDAAVRSMYGAAIMQGEDMLGQLWVENPRNHLMDSGLLETLSRFFASEICKRDLYQRHTYLNYHDELTGQPNRASYEERLSGLREDALSSMGVVSVDINGLKEYNRLFGYPEGDGVMRRVAGALSRCYGQENVYRFAGDEFLVLCQDVTQEAFLEKLDRARELTEQIYPGCISMGQTWADADISVQRMIHHADELLLIAKQEHYSNCPTAGRYHRPEQRRGLLAAIGRGELQLYLQPKADIARGAVTGAEALVRYVHPEKGVIPPDKFLPQLEEAGLIHHVDLFMLEEACRLLSRWRSQGLKVVPISVNFSRGTLLEPNLVSRMDGILRAYPGVEREMLEIEITESLRSVERTTLTEVGRQIIQAGYRLSLDDFGAEYSNIYILSTLPLNTLKIDRRIISDLYSNKKTELLIANLIDTCKKMEIESVAEGVETPEQLEILKKLGCTYAQGYLYNKPIPAEAFRRKYLDPAVG